MKIHLHLATLGHSGECVVVLWSWWAELQPFWRRALNRVQEPQQVAFLKAKKSSIF
jgi:hypothetical protein